MEGAVAFFIQAMRAVVEVEDPAHTRAPSSQTQAPCATLQSRLDQVAPRGSVKKPLHREREALVAHPALVSN